MDSGKYFLVQVENITGKRWKSSGLQLDDEIPVVPTDETHQFWHLERDPDLPHWSFYTKSADGKKLYVTYDGSDEQNKEVTLKYDSDIDSTQRNFLAFRQPGISFVLTSLSNKQRVLAFDGGVLVMTDAEPSIPEREWIISPGGREMVGQSLDCYHEIQRVGSLTKWISSQASIHDNIRVLQSSTQDWITSGTVISTSFKVPSQGFFASRIKGSKEEMLFENAEGRAAVSFREFSIHNAPSIGPQAVTIRALSNGWFVGTNDSNLLELKEAKVDAGGWELLTTHMVFSTADEETIIFPPFKVDSEPATEDT